MTSIKNDTYPFTQKVISVPKQTNLIIEGPTGSIGAPDQATNTGATGATTNWRSEHNPRLKKANLYLRRDKKL
jgi:hypothetical protein